MDGEREVLVEVKNLSKNFGVTIALNHVNMQIKRGEIRGLIGENGSGKSTISTIIAGIQQPTNGEMFYKGQQWAPATSLEATRQGIACIVQEVGTVATVSVAENIFIGDYDPFKRGPFVSRKKMIAAAQNVLNELGIDDINPAMLTATYNMEQRKLIEIAKAMANQPEMIIVDETSTALSEKGRNILYRLMHKAAQANCAVVFISHDLEELIENCDTMTILRDGEIVDNLSQAQFDPQDIKQKMIGREIGENYYRVDQDAYQEEIVLKANHITTMTDLLCFDLELHKGEILGIGGLSECGMHTLGRALYGLEDIVDGEVVLPQTNATIKKPRTAFRNKMGYVSKNRDRESLELNASVGANIQSTGYDKNRSFGPFISKKKERAFAQLQVDELAIKCTNLFQPVRALSGGNKQKVVFGKWLADDADILILDCPTRGVDIGVKASMYQLIYEMKKKNKSILLISEELPELCGMSDRLLIMRNGAVTGEFFRKDGFDNNQLIECMI